MILNNLIYIDNKLINHKFIIQLNNDNIIINTTIQFNELIKIPIYNIYNGIVYEPILFPLKMFIFNNKVFNPYIILSTYNLKTNNDIDFFNKLNCFINDNYNLQFYSFDKLINDNNNNLFSIINKYYTLELNKLFITKNNNFNIFIKSFWNNLNIIKIYIIYILIKFPYISNKNINKFNKKFNIPKYILNLVLHIKMQSYNLIFDNQNIININNNSYFDYILSNNNNNFIDFFKDNNKLLDNNIDNLDNHIMIFNDYYLYDNKLSLLINNININKYYYIIYDNDNIKKKVLKIFVLKINNDIITISNNQNILFNNYKWYYYYPNIIFNKEYVIFNTFINNNFIKNILNYIIKITNNKIIENDNFIKLQSNKIIEYYNLNNKLSNILLFYNNFIDLNIIQEYNDFYNKIHFHLIFFNILQKNILIILKILIIF